MLREVTLVSHISRKTDLTDYRERCWKRSHAGLTLLNVVDSFTKGFLEILLLHKREKPIFHVWKAKTSHVVALH